MPELPEVQTIVNDLNKTIKGLKITGVWIDQKKMIKKPSYKEFEKQITGKKILNAKRRAKYILINLSGGKTLIIHQKISGHLLYGKWIPNKSKEETAQKWIARQKGPLKDDPQNRFIRFILFLSSGKMLALSDLRRFAKILLVNTKEVENLKEIKKLGPEPLGKSFTFKVFKEILKNKKGKIKTVLMDQKTISGIGNIYSDEILWYAGIHPAKKVEDLKEKELKSIFNTIKKVLPLAVKFKGDSIQDYRRLSGEKGRYQYVQKVYQMTGKKCAKKDGGIIKKIKIGGRSAHFCPVHQKL